MQYSITSTSRIPVFLGALIPGWGHLFNGNIFSSLFFQLAIISGVFFLSWSRLVLHPLGFFALLIFAISMHILSSGLNLTTRARIKNKDSFNNKVLLFIFPVIFLSVFTFVYFFRETLLGFGLYHIQSNSMEPALLPGDIIIVNTWVYKDTQASQGDIALFTKSNTNSQILVKRIQQITYSENDHNHKYYLVGDNKNSSSDSRHFGWIRHSLLKGKASSILFTYTNNMISFYRTGIMHHSISRH